MRDLNVVAEQLFNEIRGRFPSVTIGDGEGNTTNEPSQARFYEFDFKSLDNVLGKVSVSLDEKSGVTIMYNKDFTEEVGYTEQEDWYNFLKGMRVFAKKRLLNFEVRDINKSNFTQRDYSYMAANRGETKMNESALRGTDKTSFQKIGNAKLRIKHTGPIGEGESRTKKIGSLFIENAEGEKFKYPFKHLSGARAMAIHVSEGGHPFDDFGKHITGLSEELSNLRKFKTYMGRSSVMAESLAEHMDTVNERIVAVKKTVQSLQKPSNYKTAFESFEPSNAVEVPEDVAENWIDQLTVKQFNEELKDVFPYIYKLVGESTKANELAFEDIINELDSSPRPKLRPNMSKEVFSSEQEAIDNAMSKGYQEVDVDFEIIPAKGRGFMWRQIGDDINIGAGSQRGPEGEISTKGVNTESQIDTAFDKLLGQFADNFSAQVEGEIANTLAPAFKNLYMTDPEEKKMQAAMQKHKNDPIAMQDAIMDLYSDDPDFQAWIDKKGRKSKTYQSFLRAIGESENEGNAYAHAVRQAKMNGKKKGDKVKGPDGDEITLEKDQKTPLGEFILSYFDRQTGKFPKGETAVLTSVEKDYGDQYVKPASQFIERLGKAYTKYQQKKLGEVDIEENFLSRMIGAEGVKPADFVKKAMQISQRYENLAFKNKIASDPNRPFNGKQGGTFLIQLYMELINMSREIQKLGGGNKTMVNAQQQMSLIRQAMAGPVDNPEAIRLMKAAPVEPKFIIDFVKQDIQSIGNNESQQLDRITSLAGLR
jgi:hypothetical protein